ncbi:MAG TPA: response regulator, partial [Dehalococcoidia bacterium]|nr:response regulator [Dehalococcoidia bacterium]
MKALIVEDDDSVGRFLERAMGEAGYAVQLANDGSLALDMARATDFDLILLDVMIPSVDGFEVCRRLRASKVRAPILIITAKDTLEDKIEGLDSGADD